MISANHARVLRLSDIWNCEILIGGNVSQIVEYLLLLQMTGDTEKKSEREMDR